MTSANSSSKIRLTLAACRNRLWLFILGFIVFLFALPVSTALQFGNYGRPTPQEAASSANWIANEAHEVLTANFITSITVMCGAALLCGLVCFRYQQNRKQVDFYNSMPLSRGS